MENVILTLFTIPEVKQLLHQELDTYFSTKEILQGNNNLEFLNVQEAAEFLKMSTSTIYALVSRREIPVCKRAKRLYFDKDELANWIRNGRQKTSSEMQDDSAEQMLTKNRRRL